MKVWDLDTSALSAITLAADARLNRLDYTNDHIWELTMQGGEPTSLALQTNYGLRALNMRLFPRFTEGETAKINPQNFKQPPIIRRLHPDFLLLTFSPFEGVDVVSEYWVHSSQSIAGRLRVINSGVIPRKLQLDWIVQLIPGDEGHRMAPVKIQSVNVLQGQVDRLVPLVFMTGGPEASHSPYPALSVPVDLLPGGECRFKWVHVAHSDADSGFELARQIVALNWDAEISRIEMINESLPEIQTGNQDWNLAIALGQKKYFELIHGPTDYLPFSSFVSSRKPDQGYSMLGDGTDYDNAWNGQPVLESWYLISQILPTAPDIAKGLLKNFISTQNKNGGMSWKPSMSGKHSDLVAPPLLSSLAWKIYEYTEDTEFLEESFPHLLRFVHHWLSSVHDRDGDGIPEWDHILQTGFEENPLFSLRQPWSQGVDITLFESPGLCALLYRECHSLILIARLLEKFEPITSLEARRDNLRAALEMSWDTEAQTFFYFDRDSHFSPPSSLIFECQGAGTFPIENDLFEGPIRLLIRIHSSNRDSPREEAQIEIHGTSLEGASLMEAISATQGRWFSGVNTLVTDQTYTALDQINILSIQPDDRVEVQAMDFRFQDQTLLLPLWAGALTLEQADELVKNQICRSNRYWKNYGLSACAQIPHPEAQTICESIWMPWNSLIGEGLINFGYRHLAAELVSRNMEAIIKNLKTKGVFYKHYHAKTGQGIGELNSLIGLPPLGLFLETLGIRLISPWKVAIQGQNFFPWSVQIKFRGLTIQRGLEETIVTFPSGESVTIDDPTPCVVSGKPMLEDEKTKAHNLLNTSH